MYKIGLFFILLIFCDLLLWSGVIELDGIDDHVHFFDYTYSISNNLTVEAWIKGASPNGVVASVWLTATDKRSWRFFADGTKISASVSSTGNFLNSFSVTSNSDVFDNDWHHVAFTFSSGTLSVFVDGTFDNSSTDGTITSIYTADPAGLVIGYSDAPVTFTNIFDGFIDEVRIWSVALTESQIQAMDNKILTESNGNLATGLNWTDLDGYWRFEEGSGTVAYDSSQNSHSGIMMGWESTNSVEPMPNNYTLIDESRSFPVDIVGMEIRIISGTGAQPSVSRLITNRVNTNRIEVSSANPFSTSLDKTSAYHITTDQLWFSDNPLPVVMNSFTATYASNSASLNWETQSELNSFGWNVYKAAQNNLTIAAKLNNDIIEGAENSFEPCQYSFTDETLLESNTTYWYWLENLDYSGNSDYFGPIELFVPSQEEPQDAPDVQIPEGIVSNYPNPFNPTTTIKYHVDMNASYTLDIFDLKGKKIHSVSQGTSHTNNEMIYTWNGFDDSKREVGTGIYFAVLKTDKTKSIQKMVLIK